MTRFVADPRALNVTPHIAQYINGRRSGIDGLASMNRARTAHFLALGRSGFSIGHCHFHLLLQALGELCLLGIFPV
jgi:hypothetical protein